MPRPKKSAADKERGARLGRSLREARQPRSQSQIATDADVPLDTLRGIEQGRVADPGLFTVAAIASELNLSLDDLAGTRKRTGR